MKMKVKLKENGKWRQPTGDELEGISLVGFMCDSFDPMVAALYKEDKIEVIISNKDEILETYSDKGIATLHSDTLNLLMGDKSYMNVVYKVFKGSDFVEVTTVEA